MNAPMKTENQVANNEPASIKQYVSDQKIRQKFEEILGKKTQGFLASVMQVANQPHLKNAIPATVVNAAMMAATLDLPINSNLGFAYIVPYKRKFKDGQGRWQESNEAQFQVGTKGFRQLAIRSGQFERIASTAVYQGQLIKADPLLGYEWDWNVLPEGNPVGYVAFFKLLNGFTSELYMTIAQINSHAQRYSQAYKNGYGPWKDNFEAMAEKTVIKLLLSKEAPLSIEMQTAQLADQSIVHDVATNDFEYIDHQENVAELAAPTQSLDQEQFKKLIASIQSGDLDKAFVLSGEAGYTLTTEQQQELAGA